MPTQPISNLTNKAATSIEASVRVTRLPLPSSSVFHTPSLGNFREAHMREAQFPRTPLLGNRVNRGNPSPYKHKFFQRCQKMSNSTYAFGPPAKCQLSGACHNLC